MRTIKLAVIYFTLLLVALVVFLSRPVDARQINPCPPVAQLEKSYIDVYLNNVIATHKGQQALDYVAAYYKAREKAGPAPREAVVITRGNELYVLIVNLKNGLCFRTTFPPETHKEILKHMPGSET